MAYFTLHLPINNNQSLRRHVAGSRWNYDKLGQLSQWTLVTNLVHYKVRWNYDKLRQLSSLQNAMNSCLKFWQICYKVWHGLTCDKYYIVRWIYYKMRQVLQSAMIIRTMIANVHSHYYTIKFWCTFRIISINWPLTGLTSYTRNWNRFWLFSQTP